MNQNLEHLRWLSIGHYILAAFSLLGVCIPVFHLTFGLGLLSGAIPMESSADQGVGRVMGAIFAGVACLIMSIFAAYAGALAFAGQSLASKKRYTFCLIVAGINCLFAPLGTVVGVFTIIVLMRPEVKELFQNPALAPSSF